MSLDPSLHAKLLRHARAAIIAYLTGEDQNDSDESWPPEVPQCGAFVTLRKLGQLRGCIGVFSTTDDLPTTVARMALAAAKDPRFVDIPLSPAEMKNVRIEISLLSPLERIGDPMDFELGRHGIYIRNGHAVGCFLPDVATERCWDKETFLTQCCLQKAGLDPAAWNMPETEVFRFHVEKIAD